MNFDSPLQVERPIPGDIAVVASLSPFSNDDPLIPASFTLLAKSTSESPPSTWFIAWRILHDRDLGMDTIEIQWLHAHRRIEPLLFFRQPQSNRLLS